MPPAPSELKRPRRNYWIIAIKYAISVAIIVWLVGSHRDQVVEFFETPKRYPWWAIGLVTMTAAFLFSFIRWKLLANAIDLNLSTADAIRLGFIGSFFNVIAFGVVGGDSTRAFYISRKSPGRIAEAILSVFMDRVIGLIVMCGFAGTAYLINGIPGPENGQKQAIVFLCQFAGLASLAGMTVLATMVFFPGLRNAPIVRSIHRLPAVGSPLKRIMDAAALFSRRKSVIPLAMLMSCGTNVMFAVTIYLVALAIAPEVPSIGDHFVLSPIAMVANSIPLPGGIGGMEAAMAWLYSSFEFPGGLLVALGYRLCLLFVSLIGWFVWLMSTSSAAQPPSGERDGKAESLPL